MYSSKQWYTYILASKKNGTLYVWVTSFLIARIYQHRTHKDTKSFTAKYDCTVLVYYELHNHIDIAIEREKQIKSWKRQKKIDLIQTLNPEWRDLYEDIV